MDEALLDHQITSNILTNHQVQAQALDWGLVNSLTRVIPWPAHQKTFLRIVPYMDLLN